jgi:type I restriction enzyme R subunit
VTIYNEQSFEVAIEGHLLAHGWTKGSASHFDRELALDPHHVLGFITDTQPEVWTGLRKQHGVSVDKTVIEWLAKALDTQGTLDVLRHGFKFPAAPLSSTPPAALLLSAG